MIYSNGSSNALFFNTPEIKELLDNYNLDTIEVSKNANLVLEGTKIKLWKSGDELICQAGRLLLERGKSFKALIDDTYDKIRLMFELNSLLKEEVTFYLTLSEREKAFLKFPNK